MFKFSIKTALFAFRPFSFLFCAWQITSLHNRLKEAERCLECSEYDCRIASLSLELLCGLENSTESDAEELERIRWILGQIPRHKQIYELKTRKIIELLTFNTRTQIYDIDYSQNIELISFYYDSMSHPGRVTTVLALFQDGKLVDHVFRDASTWVENWHETIVEDFNHDGILDVAINIPDGTYSNGRLVKYEINSARFLRINQESAN